ncbi:MAG: transporter [Candidatus Kapaibacterium sp.]
MQFLGTSFWSGCLDMPFIRRAALTAAAMSGFFLPISAQTQSAVSPFVRPLYFDIHSLHLPFSALPSTPATSVYTTGVPESLSPDVVPPGDSNAKAEDDDFEETIVTDRPDQTEAPPLTPKGWFQFEFGIQSEFDEDKDTKVKTQSTLYNTTLWKYGLTKSIELRLITEFGEDKVTFKNAKNEDTTTSVSGLNPITVGLKIPLQKEQGIVPDISLITHLELPYIGSEDFRPEFVIPRFRFLFAHTLSETFSLSYNLGGEWEDGTSAATGIYTVSLGMSLAERLAMFVEAYGFTKEKSFPDHRFDAGATYQLTNDLQFDTSGGFGLTERSPDYFISAGFSLRFKAFK